MRRQGKVVMAKECDATASKWAVKRMARKRAEGSDPRVQSVTVIAARKVAQLTGSTWNAVVTSGGNGTFLVRRRKDRLSSQCPLLCYEVRSIEPIRHYGPHDRLERGKESDGQSGDESIARHPAAVTVSARASDSPRWDCGPKIETTFCHRANKVAAGSTRQNKRGAP